ncbi:transmembrane protein 154 [Lepus europaeus]|uniref:transmembrane protein 154 n=1 Tax=Lepus europaeus TaxID=9983 RepID=UPI002B45E117|nr:transmembrane protein 154 [Lepus europaeus]XP_062055471.1 transmembrane protein 154 [Lepus europaeus]
MRAPRAALVLALLTALAPAARADREESEQSGDMAWEDRGTTEEAVPTTFDAATTESLTTDRNLTHVAEDENQLDLIFMVLIPLVLLALLLLLVVSLVVAYKRKRAKQEPSSQGSQDVLQTCGLGGENMKVPIFEEDTPSVMEIEMEELDKWMISMNRNADHECLPTLKEEKESNHSPSDSEP